MSTEYVKLAPSELIHGETSLLQTQMSLLMILKQYKQYESLRKEELFLKLELKKKLGEAKESLDELSKSLPESKFFEEQEKKERIERELVKKVENVVQKPAKEEKIAKKTPATMEVREEKSPLDKELEEIRGKLERLQ